jgi:hypothetical protein
MARQVRNRRGAKRWEVRLIVELRVVVLLEAEVGGGAVEAWGKGVVALCVLFGVEMADLKFSMPS